MKIWWRAVVLSLVMLLGLSPSLAAQLSPVNTFEVVGEITHVDNENDFFVVTVQDTFQDIVVVCDVDVRPGCAELEEGKEAVVKGHFGLVGEACSGREIYYNPLIPDDLWQCDGVACEQL